MRTLTDHIVPGDSSNHQLEIQVTDEPGAGGANHRYEITGFDTKTNPSAKSSDLDSANFPYLLILFQNDPIKEASVNGITQEALLAIVIDRLRSFQSGPYACQENADALICCESALLQLQERTKKRLARGVEGTLSK